VAKANAVITECTIKCMQFVFVRPITAVISFVLTTLLEGQAMAAASAGGATSSMDDDTLTATSHTTTSSSSWHYFSSPAFYCDMIVNLSIIIAFNGLLKFHHAVDQQLAWIQPFQKFLTVKAVVFLTFWQGLAISIIVQLQATSDNTNSNSSSNIDSELQAAQLQNFLICLEMLFFSIAHWFVFPVEEWEADYRPQVYAKPGIGLKDFVQDVGYIISSRSDARRYRHKTAQQQLVNRNGNGNDGEGELRSHSMDELELHVETGLDDAVSDYVDVVRPDVLVVDPNDHQVL
jgi:hypothetical protein